MFVFVGWWGGPIGVRKLCMVCVRLFFLKRVFRYVDVLLGGGVRVTNVRALQVRLVFAIGGRHQGTARLRIDYDFFLLDSREFRRRTIPHHIMLFAFGAYISGCVTSVEY